MRPTLLLLLLASLLIAACEPLAPPANQQQVIIVTSTPTDTPFPTRTQPFNSTIATRVATATPTDSPTPEALPTATVPPCDESSGRLFESSFDSEIVGGLVPYNIYLPPCFFQSGRRFPFVVLFHGSGYTFEQWLDLDLQAVVDGGIAEGSLSPMVLVMPEGGVYQENNWFEPGNSYEDIILNELLPHLEQNFCLENRREGRAIGGISRGGFWAMAIAFRNPDVFGAVGGHSPFFVPDNAPTTHNPLALAESAFGIEALRIYLDNSQTELGAPNIEVFANSLQQRGILHEHVVAPNGEHDNDYWAAHLSEYLAFYSAEWPPTAADLPSCQS